MPQTVSLGTAQRLKAAGLEQGIHYGDYYAMTKITEVSDAQPFSLPILAKSAEQIEWLEAHRDSYVRLPHLGDELDEIERLVPDADIRFDSCNGKRRCHVRGDDQWLATCFGPNDIDAAGEALAQIMEAQHEKV